ncbi:MAG: hypothetical protein HRF42_11110 [Candidatus Brocadia sp.]
MSVGAVSRRQPAIHSGVQAPGRPSAVRVSLLVIEVSGGDACPTNLAPAVITI